MKKRGTFFIVIVMVALLSFALAACDEVSGAKKPTHLSFDNPYITTTPGSPVYLTGEGMEEQEGDFDLSKVKMYVEYSDGTKGEPITVTESMLAAESDIEYTSFSRKQTYVVKYAVEGVTVEGTFRVYSKVRTEADLSTLTFVTNGGTPNTFTKKVTNGTIYNTYTSFTSSFAQVTKAGYTLLGWVIIPSSFDYENKTSDEINTMADELNTQNKTFSATAFPSLGITIDQSTAFCAVWQANTTNVTFNYNFAAFNITSDLYAGSGLSVTPTTTKYAPSSTIVRPIIADDAVKGWKFAGWCTDIELRNGHSFNKPVGEADINLYAKWEQILYSITFNLVGGTLNADDFIVDEVSSALYEKQTSTQTAAPDLLRGKVSKYDSKGNIAAVVYNNLSYGSKLNISGGIYHYLAKPTMEIESAHYLSKGEFYDSVNAVNDYYYEFSGWYTDPDYTTAYNFTSNSVVGGDLMLHAKWVIKSSLRNQYYENYLFKDKYLIKPDNTIKITGINDLNVTEIDLPVSIAGKNITEIGDDAFAGCILLKSFSITENSLLTTIGARSFRFCSKLEKFDVVTSTDRIDVTFATNIKVNSVGKDAFRGTLWISASASTTPGAWSCISIGKVLVKFNGSESIERIVFSKDGMTEAERLVSAAYGNTLANVTTISADAFKGLSRLTYIEIPDSITKIENYAFAGCTSLSNIVVKKISDGGKLTEVGEAAFSDTNWFRYPSSADSNYTQYSALILGSIYYRFAGSHNSDTNRAIIPAGISIIAPDAFQDCDNIRSITFNQKALIATIGENAFNDTAWYELQGNANDGFIIVNGILIGYIGTGKVVTASDGLSTLRAVYIPEKDVDGVTVKKIGTNAFYGYYANNINAIAMPETITEIEPYAFRGATGLTVLSYLGSAKPHIFDGAEGVINTLPKLYESSFYGATSGVLVNAQLVFYLTTEQDVSGNSLYKKATLDSSTPIYYELYIANNNFIKTLNNNGIRVKAGTLPEYYINSPGWTIDSEWTANRTFDPGNVNRAMLVIMRTDGLPYETSLLREYINDLDVKSTITGETPHILTITYPNLEPCEFAYYVEPKINSISIDNGASENSLMSQAVYFTTSKRFVYAGGYITITYADAGVAPLTLSLTDIVGTDKPIQISGFLVTRADIFQLKFTYTKHLQSVSCFYSYTVSEPKDVSLDFFEPVSVEINAAVDLSLVLIEVIRDDYVNGGQAFDVDSSHESYFVTMKNAKVRIVSIDGMPATQFDTSTQGMHTIGIKYGSDALGYTETVTLNYEVVLKTLDSWFTYNVLTTTTDVWGVVDDVTIFNGTASITGILSGHLPTIVIPDYISAVINSVRYNLKVVDIAASAFENDSIVVDVYIASTVAIIYDKAFLNCINLENVYFMVEGELTPALTNIGNRVFEGCTKLTTIDLPSGVAEVGNSIFAYSGMTTIDLSDTQITELSTSMFSYCTALSSVILPSDLTVVGNSAFYGCTSLSNIDLGANIEFIGSNAFSYCITDTNTLTITISATTVPTLGTEALGVPSASLSIKVPSANLSTYTSAWTQYASYISAI